MAPNLGALFYSIEQTKVYYCTLIKKFIILT